MEHSVRPHNVKSCRYLKNNQSQILVRSTRGFTLVEVLVALVFVGLTLPALTLRVQSILDNSGHMDQKTVAYWVAENKFQEIILERKFDKVKEKPPKKKVKGKGKAKKETYKFADVEWHITIESEVFETGIPDIDDDLMEQVIVKVGLQPDVQLVSLSGYFYE